MADEKKSFWEIFTIVVTAIAAFLVVSAVLPPSLSLLDGITAMPQSGPLWGQPYPLALVAASMNPVAIDTALHVILGVSPEQSSLMAACRRAGLNGAELPQLSFPLLCPEDFSVSGFIVPETLNPVRFTLARTV